MGLALLALAGGVLFGGAELFAEHAAAAGDRLGVSALAVGVLLAGAEPEELITAVTAAARDRPGIAVGDAIGANITMLTLALGLAAMLGPLPLGGRVRSYAVGLALAFASARRNVSELAVAAVVGSAAYNLTATLGAAALVHPAGGVDVRAAAVVAAALPVVVLALGGRQQRLPRAAGAALVGGYVVFVVVVVLR